jgi:heme exporter protein CcmD
MTQEFWAMGGYARFVWPCVGFVLAVLAWNLYTARRAYDRALQRARRALAMERP